MNNLRGLSSERVKSHENIYRLKKAKLIGTHREKALLSQMRHAPQPISANQDRPSIFDSSPSHKNLENLCILQDITRNAPVFAPQSKSYSRHRNNNLSRDINKKIINRANLIDDERSSMLMPVTHDLHTSSKGDLLLSKRNPSLDRLSIQGTLKNLPSIVKIGNILQSMESNPMSDIHQPKVRYRNAPN